MAGGNNKLGSVKENFDNALEELSTKARGLANGSRTGALVNDAGLVTISANELAEMRGRIAKLERERDQALADVAKMREEREVDARMIEDALIELRAVI